MNNNNKIVKNFQWLTIINIILFNSLIDVFFTLISTLIMPLIFVCIHSKLQQLTTFLYIFINYIPVESHSC